MKIRRTLGLLLSALTLLTLLAKSAFSPPLPHPSTLPAVGVSIKGLNYADDSLPRALELGVQWLKIYDHPPDERLPTFVLYRVNLPLPGEDWDSWGHYRFLDAQLYADRIDAYEIGNEPNIASEWGLGPPDPAAYTELLRIAYTQIKSADPDAIIVTGGLAPVGNTNTPDAMDDRLFLEEMYAHGAADYFDVLGVHPYGFAYPPEIDPEAQYRMPGGHITLDTHGLCFRRVEHLRAIMEQNNDGDKPIWATEFGWIISPPSYCLSMSDWPQRAWQAITPEQQADYLVRAIQYAGAHWPWMGVMIIWNLDYSRYPPGESENTPSPECETMGWYSLLNPDGTPRPAYFAIQNLLRHSSLP